MDPGGSYGPVGEADLTIPKLRDGRNGPWSSMQSLADFVYNRQIVTSSTSEMELRLLPSEKPPHVGHMSNDDQHRDEEGENQSYV